jgi:hypothetical protein
MMYPVIFLALSVLLFAFSPHPGGDSFSISVNKKLLFLQYAHADKSVRTVALANVGSDDVLNVMYSHCGKSGSDRSITIRDAGNKILKEWHYANVLEKPSGDMSCNAKDILLLSKSGKAKLNLVYASRELPEGKTLAILEIPADVKASIK